jgi:hypothetical protein
MKKENCATQTDVQFTVLKWKLSAKRIQLRKDYWVWCMWMWTNKNSKIFIFLDTCQWLIYVTIFKSITRNTFCSIASSGWNFPFPFHPVAHQKYFSKYSIKQTLSFCAFEWLLILMAVYYVASKLSIVACSTHCISQRRRRRNKCQSNKHDKDKSNAKSDEDTDGAECEWKEQDKEVRLLLWLALYSCINWSTIKGF